MSAIPMMQGPGLAGPARRGFAGAGAPQVDLGHEPALSRDGEGGGHDRRSVSLRWLAGIPRAWAPPGLDDTARRQEGWIFGVGMAGS